MSTSLPPGYFDTLYEANPDPWDFTRSEYEAEKYARTIATLDRPSYSNALEIGCSIGVLTAKLAQKCERLLSIDVSEKALSQARHRNASAPNVTFELRSVPNDYPDQTFDLTVVSEVGYYWSMPDLKTSADLIYGHSAGNGQLLLVHYLPAVPDYPLTGGQVHEFFLKLPQWRCVASHRAPKYRIELLQKQAAVP